MLVTSCPDILLSFISILCYVMYWCSSWSHQETKPSRASSSNPIEFSAHTHSLTQLFLQHCLLIRINFRSENGNVEAASLRWCDKREIDGHSSTSWTVYLKKGRNNFASPAAEKRRKIPCSNKNILDRAIWCQFYSDRWCEKSWKTSEHPGLLRVENYSLQLSDFQP